MYAVTPDLNCFSGESIRSVVLDRSLELLEIFAHNILFQENKMC